MSARVLFILAALQFHCGLSAGTLVQFRTVLGDLEVELLDQEKPLTSSNFLRYVREGAYSDSFFHRQVPGFVMQGGGFRIDQRGTPTAFAAPVQTHPPVTNEFAVAPLVSNTRGTLAMAKTKDPNSATSQFFFNLADNRKSLDNPANSGGFTVFGRVVGGTNTLSLFDSFADWQLRKQVRQPLTNVLVNAGETVFPFGELPLTLLSTNTANQQLEIRLENLLYVDVTTLKVAVKELDSGSKEISWNGIAHATNVVEYTTVFPPQWQVWTNLVRPTASRPAVVDDSGDSRRFYRVRATF